MVGTGPNGEKIYDDKKWQEYYTQKGYGEWVNPNNRPIGGPALPPKMPQPPRVGPGPMEQFANRQKLESIQQKPVTPVARPIVPDVMGRAKRNFLRRKGVAPAPVEMAKRKMPASVVGELKPSYVKQIDDEYKYRPMVSQQKLQSELSQDTQMKRVI
jgi:hypothetical protein